MPLSRLFPVPRFRPTTGILLPLLAVLFLADSSALGGTQVFLQVYPELGDSEVQVEALFLPAAKQGELPFLVSIRNATSEDRSWTIRLSEGRGNRAIQTRTEQTIPVRAGGSVRTTMLLPFAPEFANGIYRYLEVGVSSPGTALTERTVAFSATKTLPTIAMSSPLALRSLAGLDERVKDRNSANQRFATSFSPSAVPDDWRAFTGLDVILMDVKSWEDLRPQARAALLRWIRLGGRLDLFAEGERDKSADFGLLGIDGLLTYPGDENTLSTARVSLGTVRLDSWDGKELRTSLSDRYENEISRADLLNTAYTTDWELGSQLGIRQFRGPLLAGVLLAFAILVAPVNLFWFARKGKRHRLFVTVPAISFGACLIIVLVIIIGDGFGGRGYRSAFVDIQGADAERRSFVTQEQISRTGVMTDRGFTSQRDLVIDPIHLGRNRFAAFLPSSRRSANLSRVGDRYDGDYFSSRADQGFVIRSSEPTRARIEGEPAGDSLRITSVLPSALESLFYRDQDGKTWASPEGKPIAPGETVDLQPIDDGRYRGFLEESTTLFSVSLAEEIRNLAREKGRFFAIPADPTEWAIDTHPSIRWTETHTLVSGGIVSASTAPRNE